MQRSELSVHEEDKEIKMVTAIQLINDETLYFDRKQFEFDFDEENRNSIIIVDRAGHYGNIIIPYSSIVYIAHDFDRHGVAGHPSFLATRGKHRKI